MRFEMNVMSGYFNPADLKVGEIVSLTWVRSYQHGATMRITKINKKSIDAEEIQGSYGGPRPVGDSLYKRGKPAATWRLHKESEFRYHPNAEDRFAPSLQNQAHFDKKYGFAS